MTEKSEKPTYEIATISSLMPEDVKWEDMKENLAELDISSPRIRFSSSDALFFLSEDDAEGVKSFSGIIHWYTKQNTYWESSFDQNNTGPPTCFSKDGKTGSKFGDCISCKFNQFGSNGGKGKACRNQIKLFVQVEGRAIPMTLLVSPKNLRAFTNAFMVDVTQRGLAYWKVKARFTAYKNKEKREAYARLKIEIGGVFKGDELKQLSEIREFWLKPIQTEHFAASNQEFTMNDDSVAPVADDVISAIPATEEAKTEVKSEAKSEVKAEKPAKSEDRVVAPKSSSKKKVEFVADDDEEPPF